MTTTNYQSIIFDFDGVLVDSINIKTNAFATIYAPYGQKIVEQIVAYHLANGGVSRYEKFKYGHETLLDMPMTPNLLKELDQQFAILVKEEVIKAPAGVGAISLLESIYQQVDCYIASGTPELELLDITVKRQMAPYFKGIYGSPTLKSIIIDRIIREHGYDRHCVLMVGDAITDYLAACANQIAFVGVSYDPSVNPFQSNIPCIADLRLILSENIRNMTNRR